MVGVLGATGRMGCAFLEEMIKSKTLKFQKGTFKTQNPRDIAKKLKIQEAQFTQCASDVFESCHIVVDFSHSTLIKKHLELAAAYKKPFLLGTTGLNDRDLKNVTKTARTIPLLHAPNTSIGATWLKILVYHTASILDPMFNVAILDKHHKHKKDAPSGTAIMLAKSIKKGYAKKNVCKDVQFTSVRTGELHGEHHVTFTGENECITLSHQLFNRHALAKGALMATKWLTQQKKPGLYAMENVLQQKFNNF